MNKEHAYIIEELARELGARRDGSGRNLIARCPYCGKEGKYGVYIGPETARKKPFMAHCFSCGASTHSLERTLEALGRMDLLPTPTTDPEAKLDCNLLFPLDAGEEIDDELGIVELPEFYKRTFLHPYLKGRGIHLRRLRVLPSGYDAGPELPLRRLRDLPCHRLRRYGGLRRPPPLAQG